MLHPVHFAYRNFQECSTHCDHLMARPPRKSGVLPRCTSPPGWLTVFASGACSDGFLALAAQAAIRSHVPSPTQIRLIGNETDRWCFAKPKTRRPKSTKSPVLLDGKSYCVCTDRNNSNDGCNARSLSQNPSPISEKIDSTELHMRR